MASPVVYFEIGAKNAEKVTEFYRDLFGWDISPLGPASAAGTPIWSVQNEEGGIHGGIIQTDENMPPNYVMFYVQSEDIQADLDKAERLGGKAVGPCMDIPGGRGQIGIFMDPDGNVIGLHKWNGEAPEQE